MIYSRADLDLVIDWLERHTRVSVIKVEKEWADVVWYRKFPIASAAGSLEWRVLPYGDVYGGLQLLPHNMDQHLQVAPWVVEGIRKP